MGTSNNGSNGNGTGDNVSVRLPRISIVGRKEESSFREMIAKVYKHKAVATFTFLLVTAAVVVYTFTVKPVYEASTEVRITGNKSGSESMLGGLSDIFPQFGADARRVTDELAVLRTALLRDRVARTLVQHPTLEIGLRVDTLGILTPSKYDRKHGIGPMATTAEITARLFNDVSFTNEQNSDIISIAVKSHSPEEAALVANVYAKEYYNLNLSSSRTLETSVRKFLQGQLNDAKAELDSSEDNLQQYMQSQHIVSLNDESKALIQAMSTVEAQRDDVVVEEQTEQNIIGMYRGQIERMESSFTTHVSDALDPYIALLQQQIAELQVNRDVALAENPVVGNQRVYNQTVAKADSQIASLQRKLKAKTAEFLKSQIVASGSPAQSQNGNGSYDPTGYYKEVKLKLLQEEIKLSATEAQKSALDKIAVQYDRKFSRIPKQSIELAQLERNEQSKSKLFLMIQDNFQQAEIAEQSEFGYVQIIDPAQPSPKPISPKIPYNIALGIMLGLALGIGLAFVLENLDRSVESPDDLERQGFKVLASIPPIPRLSSRRGKRAREKMVELNGKKVPLRLVTIHSPEHLISESYLSLRTAVQYSKSVGNVRSLLVVSSLPREGKSTTAANLAVTFAKAGRRTLMVDADFRKPILHSLWGLERKPGLVDFLRNEASLAEIVRQTLVKNLSVITTGTIPPDPSELIGSPAMKDALTELKNTFDMVIVDSPPVLAVTDAVVLSQLTDAVLYVVSAANTKRVEIVEKGYESLKEMGASVIGFVLNEFNYKKTYDSYYKYYKGYYGQRETSEVKK